MKCQRTAHNTVKGSQGDPIMRTSKKKPIVFGLLSDEGWILERLASEISKEYPNFRYGTQIMGTPDIVYYMTYSCRKAPFPGVEIGYFTHIEEGLPAEQVFYDRAQEMDACVTQADLYRDILHNRGIENVVTIPCGVDHAEFTPRLQVGIVGRTYHTGRKGEAVIADLMDMDNVQFHFTGDGWPGAPLHIEEGKMGDFYRAMDYILVPSLYEGGPMCVPEALACGTPIIAPEIGWVPDFPHISYEKGNADSLRSVLEDLVQDKLNLAQAASSYTWKRWAEGHIELFRDTWKRCASTKANLASNRETREIGLKQTAICQVLHGGERNSQGGPSVRVPYTAEQLQDLTYQSSIEYGAPPKREYDITHLYNIWQPDSALDCVDKIAQISKKRVFSPILLDLTLQSFWGDRLMKAVQAMPESGSRFTDCLPRLQIDYEHAQSQRQSAITGYQPAPGFAAKLRAIISKVDSVVFLSEYEKELVEAYCGPIQHGTILRNPVDASFFTPHNTAHSSIVEDRLENEFGLAKGEPFLLSVGRVEVRKNQLMKAAIAKELDLPLVIAGHTGDAAYAKLVKETGGDRVHLLGRVEPHSNELLWLYQNCSLFMSLSWAEGASLSILEAASTGAPLLLADTSSEGEYFGKVAAFTDPLDLKTAVSEAQAKIMSHDNEMRKTQHEYIKERYDWPVHISGLSEIYKRLT